MTPDQQLFEKTKRANERWHTYKKGGGNICVCGYSTGHPAQGLAFHIDNSNSPKFSTPEGFFWLWERAQEKEWWELYLAGKTPDIIVSLINPLKFRAALMEFWGIKEGSHGR